MVSGVPQNLPLQLDRGQLKNRPCGTEPVTPVTLVLDKGSAGRGRGDTGPDVPEGPEGEGALGPTGQDQLALGKIPEVRG